MRQELTAEQIRNFDSGQSIKIASGKYLNVALPVHGAISIRDIAMGLSNQSRFHGQRGFYSIAQHSVRVMQLTERLITDLQLNDLQRKAVLRAALLHDAEEAFIGDLASPTKRIPEMAGFVKIGENLRSFILDQFGCLETYRYFEGEIHEADNLAYLEEAGWGMALGAHGWMPATAYARFANAFHEVRP